ncbi:hypothetical protein LCGC14_0567790 [marine sediment metagenome]|uniref:Uncharacterized protein n=1 Tax=marine sediment metagenome TaxID=412755 RepID=A0A0F9RQ98_9ZZZZ
MSNNLCPFGCGQPRTPLHWCKQGGTSGRAIVAFCSECTTSWELGFVVDTRKLAAAGLELVAGAWTGLCEACKPTHADADAEFEGLARAAAEISKVHKVSPLTEITIPYGEGFDRPGELRFGFWTVVDHSNGAAARFLRTARGIVDGLNRKHGTELLVNVNDTGAQAIVHGVVD